MYTWAIAGKHGRTAIAVFVILAMVGSVLSVAHADGLGKKEQRIFEGLKLLGVTEPAQQATLLSAGMKASSLDKLEYRWVGGAEQREIVRLYVTGAPEYDAKVPIAPQESFVLLLSNTVDATDGLPVAGGAGVVTAVKSKLTAAEPKFETTVTIGLNKPAQVAVNKTDGWIEVIFTKMADAASSAPEAKAAPATTEVKPATAASPEKTPTVTTGLPATGDDVIIPELYFREVELPAVIDILSRTGNLNIVTGDEIAQKGTVTVRLHNISVRDALEQILRAKGFGIVEENGVMRVVPIEAIQGEVVVETEMDMYRLNYADPNAVRDAVRPFLTKNGSTEAFVRSKVVMVKDVPDNMAMIRAIIPKLDHRTPQVKIDVLIVDTAIDDLSEFGVTGVFEGSLKSVGDSQTFEVTAPPTATTNAGMFSVGMLTDSYRLDATLTAEVSNSKSKVLANPTVIVMDKETANIIIAQEVPYTELTSTQQGGQLTSTQFKSIGTTLMVNPQIVPKDERVILKITPKESTISGFSETGVPIEDRREATTTLIVRSGQTMVLGGLRRHDMTNTVDKVPLLGDIPLVGILFRNPFFNEHETQLVVFLTVNIIPDELPDLTQEQRKQYDELQNTPYQSNTEKKLYKEFLVPSRPPSNLALPEQDIIEIPQGKSSESPTEVIKIE